MTEAQWLACRDSRPMVEFVRARLSDRKVRLFACVAARMVSPVSPRNRRNLRSAIAAAEASAARLGEWMGHYNREWPRPYRWTYAGTPLGRDTPFEQTRRQQKRGRAFFSPRPKCYERVFYSPRPYQKAVPA